MANATNYQVYRATSSSGSKTLITITSTTSYDDTSVSHGITYYFWVKACNSVACSSFSDPNTGWLSDPAPFAPGNVQASDGSYTDRIRVVWNSTSNADYYEVYRAASSGGARTLLSSPSNPLYDDSSLVDGPTYYYWVKACNSSDCSDFSDYDSGWRAGISVNYTLKVQISGQGSVVVDPDKTNHSSGETVTLTANADPGWRFVSWSGNLSGSNNPVTLTMNDNKTVTALFESQSKSYAAFLPATTAGYFFFATFEGNVEKEPNNNWRQANGALVSGRVYHGSLDTVDIDDYFLFVVPQTQQVEVTLWDIPKGQDYDLILRNPKLEIVDFSGSYGNKDEIITVGLPVGFYYTQVNNEGGKAHADDYSLKAIFE